MDTEFKQEPYLYKLSSLYKEDYVPGFEPEPTSASELPEIGKFAENFAKSVLEIWAGKRSASQLSKFCHISVYQDLVTSIGFQKEIGKFRKIEHSYQRVNKISKPSIIRRIKWHKSKTLKVRS